MNKWGVITLSILLIYSQGFVKASEGSDSETRAALNRFMYRTLSTMSCDYHQEVFDELAIRYKSAWTQNPISDQLATDIMEEYVDSFCLKHFGQKSGEELAECRYDVKDKYRLWVTKQEGNALPAESPFSYMNHQDPKAICEITRDDALSTQEISSAPLIGKYSQESDNLIAAQNASDLNGALTSLSTQSYCPSEQNKRDRNALQRLGDWLFRRNKKKTEREMAAEIQTPDPSYAKSKPKPQPQSAPRRNAAPSVGTTTVRADGRSTPMGRAFAAAALANTPSYKLRADDMHKSGDQSEPARYKQSDKPWDWHGCMRGVREAVEKAKPGLGEKIRVSYAQDARFSLPKAGFVRVPNSSSPLSDPDGTIHVYSEHIDMSATASDGTRLLVSDFQSQYRPGMQLLATFYPPDYAQHAKNLNQFHWYAINGGTKEGKAYADPFAGFNFNSDRTLAPCRREEELLVG